MTDLLDRGLLEEAAQVARVDLGEVFKLIMMLMMMLVMMLKILMVIKKKEAAQEVSS